MNRRNRLYHTPNPETTLYRGKVFCGKCGYGVTPHLCNGKTRRPNHRFYCNNQHANGREACCAQSFSLKRLERTCRKFFDKDDFADDFEEQVRNVWLYDEYVELR